MTGKGRVWTRWLSAWAYNDAPPGHCGPPPEGLEAGWAATGLPPPSPGLPLELLHRQHDPPEGGVRDRRERRVPGGYRGRDADVPARVHDAGVGLGVPDAEHDERGRQQEKHERDRRGGAKRRDEHVGREDAPPDQEQPDGVAERDLVGDVLGVELLERPEGEPERAVRRERDRAERVAGAELPHACEQLREAAV